MSQYVIEFGAEQLRSVVDAIKLILPEPRQIWIDSSHGTMSYTSTAKTFDELVNDLATGIVASAVIRTTDAAIRCALITSPKIHIPPLTLWMGTIEIAVEKLDLHLGRATKPAWTEVRMRWLV